ncbi:DUF5693 family protein, partial [Deinococcus pimensis]|uniref:DUF5693 family protein n=1 Tax=Deinococcus pimensis TaxID=309888 RepID=UPI000A036FD6
MQSEPATSAAGRLRGVLLVVLLLSLVPALILAWNRIRYEQASRTVTIVMDYPALLSHARNLGRDPEALLREYRGLGVNGAAVYEDVVASLVQRGEAILRGGTDFVAEDPEAARRAGIEPGWTYLSSVVPGTVEALPARYTYQTKKVRADGRDWIGWPVNIGAVSAGPDRKLIARLKGEGLNVVYRPFDSPVEKQVAADWPDVPYIAFTDVEVPGADDPARFEQLKARMGSRVPAIIEFTPQKGMDELIQDRPAIRMFSIRPEWQALLEPDEVASKFVLAARERSHRLLYVRPFDTEAQTTEFLSKVQSGLRKAGISVGTPVLVNYQPSAALRALSLLGPLVALALLALSYPLRRLGWLVALGTLALVAVTNFGSPFAAGALLAAVTFPALGFVMRRERPTDWLVATGFSLVGVLFVAALGTERLSMLGLEPFKGVGLTLVVPLGLFALSLLPRQDIRKTAVDLYNTPMKLGDLAIIMVGLAAIALIVLRRGNTPAVGVSATEAKVRALLQDNIIRPRFKEIAGHPAAILGLSKRFPPYFSYLLLLGGVVGQASILNTFSHFHTPLLISFQRAINGVAFGGVIGFVLLPLVVWGIGLFRRGPGAGPR